VPFIIPLGGVPDGMVPEGAVLFDISADGVPEGAASVVWLPACMVAAAVGVNDETVEVTDC
jgi:hypothetical protein